MKPALILAGGLGTRLRSVLGDLPKPMADVAGKPFLWWLLKQLENQGLRDAYLSVGYRHEQVRAGMGDTFGEMRLHYIVEEEPLGTGGAILKAVAEIPGDDVLVFNGDTLAVVDLAAFVADAEATRADVALAVANVSDATRYGTVEIDDARRICAFIEKGRNGPGLINAGVYHLRKAALADRPGLPQRFSFEQDFLGRFIDEIHLSAHPGVSDFIDIGVPDDYRAAQTRVPALIAGR
ncbi:nucleotidyltransferase family protein [Cupriavidus sp. UME77]|uniref:nucleotidyltransferase family protein n=1 Tax=Cupriavidus sp. UME77 TaxID=1862321 RepID=UPI0016047BAB|nr:nucleotidyltransferase family protein [Cupriavidus sp. UME77]MBB1635741.1 nucleotidyl transferase [Cupriavidus sp. UME77]